MKDNRGREFSPEAQAVIAEFVPIIKQWDVGKYAISIGGSMGKATWDHLSDIDFRLFHEKDLPWPQEKPEIWTEFMAAVDRWRENGVRIDYIWPRKISQVDADLEKWLAGEAKPDDLVWAIWGYHLLPDISNQAVIEDPDGIIQGWKDRLAHYPPALQKAILEKHGGSLRYWRHDYHYANKVTRGDVVFLAGLSARLVHDMMQVLFALNKTYFVGDGQNLKFVKSFAIQPENLAARVEEVLYPGNAEDKLVRQRDNLYRLIDDVLQLVESNTEENKD
ncbi:MAG: hypothetical protein OHK0029_16230 [Armatimonadaceae bacterium]